MRKVTINDICREAGVSICTVSKVLNNKPKVGAKTRAKVLAVIKRLNFTPNAAARNLSQRRTDTIGVIFPRYGRGMFAQLLNGIEEVTQPRNLYILAISSTDAAGEVKPYEVALRVLREQRVDGIILCNPVLSDEQVRHLKKSEIPVVVTDRLSANPTLSGVFYDSYQGGYEATKHLIDHG